MLEQDEKDRQTNGQTDRWRDTGKTAPQNKAVYTVYVAPSNVRDRKRVGPTDGHTLS